MTTPKQRHAVDLAGLPPEQALRNATGEMIRAAEERGYAKALAELQELRATVRQPDVPTLPQWVFDAARQYRGAESYVPMPSLTAYPGQLDMLDELAAAAEPAWRNATIGPPLAVHDRRCTLDPRHHRDTRCSWFALPTEAHQHGYVRLPHDMQCTSHRAGDLVPAWVCCLCDGVELTGYAWQINHGCCRGFTGMCQLGRSRPTEPTSAEARLLLGKGHIR